MQNRAQTFLDFLAVTLTDGATQRLCRDENGQWVASSRPPTWLTDGSFLLFSERTGWRHLYHYSAAGVLIRPVTAGPWEVTSLQSVDEARGVLFFCGTRDSHLARHLYRVRLDGSELTRLTHADGTHQVTVSPGGRYYIDTWSDIQLPTRVALFQGNNGVLVRRLDTNPVYAAEAWELGQYALVQIPTADGCMLDGNLLYPPDFDPKQRYPVWVQVYGGPHAPRIRNAFISRERDQLLLDPQVFSG